MKIDKKIIIVISSVVAALILGLIIYFAFFTKEEYKLTYDVNGGKSIKSVLVHEGETYKLAIPKRDGYVFVGWLNEDGEKVSKEVELKSDMKVIASWVREDATTYTVTFNSNGGSKVESVIAEEGSEFTLPANPKKTGYKFINWTNSENYVVENGFIVTEDVELKAIWEKVVSGNTDKEPNKVPSKEPDKAPVKVLTCESGYDLKGTNCVKTIDKPALLKMVCPAGTYEDDGECIKRTSSICIDEQGNRGVYAKQDGTDVCYYGTPTNVESQAACNREFQGHGGYYYNSGCYSRKDTGSAASDAKQCPRNAFTKIERNKQIICVYKEEKVKEYYCPYGKLINHDVDGSKCLIDVTVPATKK